VGALKKTCGRSSARLFIRGPHGAVLSPSQIALLKEGEMQKHATDTLTLLFVVVVMLTAIPITILDRRRVMD